ncbi:MAG TPA: DNA-processing protein DprA [Gammaproteobacteria bacterium]|nr:DNA-processing protein DprA [Gammaproteobacteria bacterium]
MQNLIYWVAAARVREVSLRKLHAWLQHYGELHLIFVAAVDDLLQFGFNQIEVNKLQKINWNDVEAELDWCQQRGEIITILDERYPQLLKEIADPPLVLFTIGDVSLLSQPQVAVVGSRHPTPIGETNAQSFTKHLVQQGIVVTSGLASGVDGICHHSALQMQGQTIAVMGTGLNEIYPRKHQKLAEDIMQNGLLVTEFPLHTRPAAWNFPRRNRIISGLSLGVLVVEAALRSGSLITARLAIEQNREVFAIPGSVHNLLARGCHQLIRQGAKLVETVDDILEELHLKTKQEAAITSQYTCANISEQYKLLLSCIDYATTNLDIILHRSGLTATEVSSILLNLELAGYVRTVAGGYVRCN